MIRPLFTSLFIMLFLAACAPGAGPLPLTGLPTSSATGDAEAEEEAPADLGDSVAEIDEAEASPTWTAPTAGSVECPALAASVSLVLDDLAAIDTEQLTLGLRVGVNQDTGSVDQQPDTSSADKEKVNWDEVRWNEMKPVKDKDDDDEGSPWKAPSLPDASDIFVIEKDSPLAPIEEVSGEPLELHGLRMFVKFPESAASSSLIPKTLVLIVIVPTRQPGRKMSESHDPCIELYEGIYDKTLLLKASYQSGEASFVGKQSFSLSRESLTTELPDLLLESTTD